ncbi:hypothetical protein N7471_010482 [Penicillium samsonianum]|uniref:uncharacterized protein n=1 Tax=Penicillium samsonianum TaxID=1882272 RepID=UPI0025488841|nr:uncharacterized protein N7471_010482 [Penicillium samsonianum]KAJ6125989.1 hypothetical protein N7471_010482 [Penicillium samsonianum]
MELNDPISKTPITCDIAYIDQHAEGILTHPSDITRKEISLVHTEFQHLKEWQRISGGDIDDVFAPLFRLYRKTFAVAFFHLNQHEVLDLSNDLTVMKNILDSMAHSSNPVVAEFARCQQRGLHTSLEICKRGFHYAGYRPFLQQIEQLKGRSRSELEILLASEPISLSTTLSQTTVPQSNVTSNIVQELNEFSQAVNGDTITQILDSCTGSVVVYIAICRAFKTEMKAQIRDCLNTWMKKMPYLHWLKLYREAILVTAGLADADGTLEHKLLDFVNRLQHASGDKTIYTVADLKE